ncbi:MAG: hypothetical protein AAFQ41_00365 [Cyanobacteria bacterium J06623_7]
MTFLDDIEDLEVFTAGEFSTPAVLTRIKSVGDPLELSGLFDANYQSIFDGYGSHQEAEGRKFCYRVKSFDTETLRHGDRLTINSDDYLITSIQPTHDGKLSQIILKQDFSV